jgi:hypothetical protein
MASVMMKPPASGSHARHRVLGTPGPTGWNDHGDPCHWRRQGPTRGPLGINDHGTPLAGKLALLLPERHPEIVNRINAIIAVADALANQPKAAKLRACLRAVKSHDSAGFGQDDVSRCVASYFDARLLALEEKTGPTTANAHRLDFSPGETLNTGAVEYRETGSFFQSPASSVRLAPRMELSYPRTGQRPPGHDTRLSAADSVSDWIEKGVADGLRDRSEPPGKLRRHE